MTEIVLADEQPDAIADRVTERVLAAINGTTNGTPSLVDAAEIARRFGVRRSWVYENADKLGAVRIGGTQGRLRFDPTTAIAALNGGAERTTPTPAPIAMPHVRCRRGNSRQAIAMITALSPDKRMLTRAISSTDAQNGACANSPMFECSILPQRFGAHSHQPRRR